MKAPMAASIEILERVVVAGGEEPISRALAGVQLLSNGDLLVAYRHASTHPALVDHIVDDGAVMTTRSTNGGRTWGEPRAVCALPGWDSAGGRSMVRTPGGELMMFVMKARRAGRKAKESYIYPIRSADEGHTWSDFGQEVDLYPGGWTEPNTNGSMHVTEDGRWMMSAYGADTHEGVTYPVVAFSDNEGRTWGDRIVVAESSPGLTFYEPAVMRLRDGRFLAMIRTQEPPFTSYRSYSGDEGGTWSAPEPVAFQGQTSYLVELPSGAVLCAYRDMAPDRHGVSASLSHDSGATWEYADRLYEGSDWNCGYPSLVQLPGGKLFCVYYTSYVEGSSEVHGALLAVRD